MSKDRIQGGLVEPTVVLNPAPQDWIPHACQVVDGFVTAQVDLPASHLLAHPLRRFGANCRCEVDEELAEAVLRPSGAKFVPKEGELLVGILGLPIIILTVDNPCLFRMRFQPASSEPTLDALRIRFA